MTEDVTKSKKIISKPLGKREFALLIDKRLHADIESQSVHHAGIYNLSLRMASFVGTFIPSGQTTLLEMALSQAISDWHSSLRDEDIQESFCAFCRSLFKYLPEVLDYTVTGKGISKPYLNYTWDCTTQTIYEWIITNRINVDEVKVIHHQGAKYLDPRDAAFLLCSKVFQRTEMKNVGITDEIHGLVR